MKKLIVFVLMTGSLLAQINTVEQGRVGPSSTSDGANQIIRLGKTGETSVSDAHGRYYEAAVRGNLFFASNQAGIATPVGLTTASKNFTLYNPAGSGKNLVVYEVICQSQTNAASGGLYLVGNLTATQAAPATNTAEAIRNALLGGAAGVGLVYNTTTLAATPVIIRPLLGLVFTTSGMMNSWVKDETAGAIIVPPGIYISIQGSAAFTVVCSMTWEEVAQ